MDYAHSFPGDDSGSRSKWQPLDDHLLEVAKLAKSFAAPAGASELAYLAGILHDIGKCDPRFQRRLEGSKLPFAHSTAGAILASRLCDEGTKGIAASLVVPIILGHHGGLPNYRNGLRLSSTVERLVDVDESTLQACRRYDNLIPPISDAAIRKLMLSAQKYQALARSRYTWTLFVTTRMVFSSLVDADWLDTERVMDPALHAMRAEAVRRTPSLDTLLQRFTRNVHAKFAHADHTPVNDARSAMRREVIEHSKSSPGVFELEMPTGSGKTVTSMDFALRHAIANGQDRIIYALPFMTVVEQNAQEFKRLLGEDCVLEHYSSYDYGYEVDDSGADDVAQSQMQRRERLLTQNWHAPVVVTTNVQLFESLFTNRISQSRKVHNIANSVIVLDEAQTLPDALLKPTLAMLESLVAVAHVSVVLCTATQPSLDEIWPFATRPIKLIKDPAAYEKLFSARVDIDTRRALPDVAYALDELTAELAQYEQVLCIVSTRKAARLLYDELADELMDEDGLFHLSAMMVPEHRAYVLDQIRSRLNDGRTCRVVSTQLVEAGVDVDFPVVFRETAGIDSILQAAGRCNREGRRARAGKVHVFCCADFSVRTNKSNWLEQMRSLGIEMIDHAERSGAKAFDRTGVVKFFDRRHQIAASRKDENRDVFRLLDGATENWKALTYGRFPYETISQAYRFIEDDSTSMFVPWGDTGRQLLEMAVDSRFDYEALPIAHRHAVSIPHWLFRKYEELGLMRLIDGFPLPILDTRPGLGCYYDERRGLIAPGEGVPEVLVIG